MIKLSSLPEPLAAQLSFFDKNQDGIIDIIELIEMIQRFKAQEKANETIKKGGKISLKAFPENIANILSKSLPYDSFSDAVQFSHKKEESISRIPQEYRKNFEDLEKVVNDLRTKTNKMIKIVMFTVIAGFIFTLGALFGLMIAADELIFTRELNVAPDGTLYSSKNNMPARVTCSL